MKKSVLVLLILICMLAIVSCARADAQKNAAAAEPAKEAAQQTLQEEQQMPQEEKQEPVEEKTLQIPAEPQQQIEQPKAEQVQEAPAADEGCTVEYNGLKLEVKSATIEKDYTGKDIIVVMEVFTNNNSYEEQFWNIGADSASQNGTALRSDTPIIADEKFFNSAVAISNGQSVPIYIPYELADANAKVEFTAKILNPNNGSVVASNSCTLTLK